MIETIFGSMVGLATSTRMLLAFTTSFLIFLVFGKRFIRFLYERKMGQYIRDEQGFLLAELHKNKKNTPTMGGLLISVATLISALMWVDLSSSYALILLSATVLFSSVGALDDWAKLNNRSSKGISGKSRMLVQTIFAACVMFFVHSAYMESLYPIVQWKSSRIDWNEWQNTLMLPFVTNPIYLTSIVGIFFSYFIQWLTIVGSANAVNLTDGLDGLASGCALFVTAFLALFAFFSNNPHLADMHGLYAIQYSGEISIYLSGLAGALIGFLWYNSHPAQVFMGDTGSLAIGGTIGTASVLLKCEWYLALVGLLFVCETLSVILQVACFKLTKKRIFRCAPLHHHFEYGGLHESKVVIRFWIVGLLLAVIGLLSLKVVH